MAQILHGGPALSKCQGSTLKLCNWTSSTKIQKPPNNCRKLQPGWLSYVINNNDASCEDFKARIQHESWKFASSVTRKEPSIIISHHDSRPSGNFEHVHVLAYHYRGSELGGRIFKWAEEIGGNASFQPVWCLYCAIQYICVGTGDKDVVHSTFGPSFHNAACRRFPREYNHQWTYEDDGEASDTLSASQRSSSRPNSRASEGSYNGTRSASVSLCGVKPTNAQKKGVELMKWLLEFIEKEQIKDYTTYEMKLMTYDDEYLEQHLAYSQQQQYVHKVEQMIRTVCFRNVNKPWHQLVENIKPPAEDSYSHYVSLKQSVLFLLFWLRHNSFDEREFCRDLRDIIDRKRQKFNLLYLYGNANCFKTTFLNSILDSCVWGVTIGAIDKNNVRFAFQPVIGKRIAYWDEVRANNTTQEPIKCVFGGESLTTDVKYQNSQELKRTPFLASSNQPLWYGVSDYYRQSFESAIRARGVVRKCKDVPNGGAFSGAIDPRAWQYICAWADIREFYTPADFGSVWPSSTEQANFKGKLLDKHFIPEDSDGEGVVDTDVRAGLGGLVNYAISSESDGDVFSDDEGVSYQCGQRMVFEESGCEGTTEMRDAAPNERVGRDVCDSHPQEFDSDDDEIFSKL